MKIVYTAEALGDVAQTLSFIAERSSARAPAVAARIDMAAKALKVFPRAARFDRETNTFERRFPDYRSYLFTPFPRN